MSLSVNIEKKMGNFLLKISFEAKQEVLAILGASGCGKSMTLKCIAGIETPDKGTIVLNDKVLFDSEKKINLPPQQRKVGYLFQQYALFPNMTVEQNIACGVRDKNERESRVKEIISAMNLKGLEKKKPHQLSGGQQQRTALARVLVNEPEVILLDEPFSALDSFLRFRLEREVQEIIRKFGKTVLLVSHDRDEVFRLSDKIVTMQDGKIGTFGTKKEVFACPRTKNDAILTGCKNISAAVKVDETHIYAKDWDMLLKVPYVSDNMKYAGIRMHDICVDFCETENQFERVVVDEIENPFSYTIRVCPEDQLHISKLGIELDKSVWREIRSDKFRVFIPDKAILLLEE